MQRLASDLSSSSSTWQVLGNTVVMGPLNTPDVETAIQEQLRGFLGQSILSVSIFLHFFAFFLHSLSLSLSVSMTLLTEHLCSDRLDKSRYAQVLTATTTVHAHQGFGA